MAQKSTGQKLATCPSNHVSFLRGTPHYPENDTAFFHKNFISHSIDETSPTQFENDQNSHKHL